jgi:hypothetical protein
MFTVYHYASARSAARQYEVELRTRSDIPAWPWNPPQALTYQSKGADEYFIGCGTKRAPYCAWVARYGVYLTVFSSSIDKQMDIQAFERIVQYLDTEVAQRLRE